MKKPTHATFDFTQEDDSNTSSADGFQSLKVTVEDAGGGRYVTFSTERWALDADEIDKFAAKLKELLDTCRDFDVDCKLQGKKYHDDSLSMEEVMSVMDSVIDK